MMKPLKQTARHANYDLFSRKSDFRFARLGETEAKRSTDDLRILRGLIAENQPMYPNIVRWFDDKVIPGLRSSERIAWVAYEGENAIASAVLKLGQKSKFCHLRIHQNFQDLELGQMFFSQMTFEARHLAKEIHFTLPESLWYEKTTFFESFGFCRAAKSTRQYRQSDEELACSAPLKFVQRAVLGKLPRLMSKFTVGGFSLRGDILMSIKPRYADRILSGSKLVEIRKKFSDRRVGARAVLYASSPQKAIVGEAIVRRITLGSPGEIWEKFGSDLGCSLAEFRSYVGSSMTVSAIEFEEVIPYREPLSLSQMSYLIEDNLRPPQSFCDLSLNDEHSAWARAVSVATLLHGRFPHAR